MQSRRTFSRENHVTNSKFNNFKNWSTYEKICRNINDDLKQVNYLKTEMTSNDHVMNTFNLFERFKTYHDQTFLTMQLKKTFFKSINTRNREKSKNCSSFDLKRETWLSSKTNAMYLLKHSFLRQICQLRLKLINQRQIK